MANTIKPSVPLLAATGLLLIFVVSVLEAAPFFINTPSMDNLPTIQMPEMRLPEIDPATMINNGGQAIARTGDGVVVMLDNGMQVFMRTTMDGVHGLMDGITNTRITILNMLRSLPFIG